MNSRAVNAAAEVILAALKQGKTLPVSWAYALESAQLLQSPESAANHRAEVQAERDAQIVAWLLKKSHEYGTSNREKRAKAEAVWRMADKLSRGAVRPDGECAELAEQAADEVDRLRARVAELEAERHTTNEALSDAAEQLRANRDRIAELEALEPAPIQTCRTCGAGYTYGQPCSNCQFQARMAAELAARQHEGELAEQRHLVDELDHALEALAPRTTTTIETLGSVL
ncbi:hypothetical protein AB0D99_32110 [Streptomyces sp. NPDC047971]|uniref:hypothetical protein n=1 Tax=Streptomyces sp. NPDC047971 TaxID=3154499 RepID=UPI0033C8F944